MAKRVIAYSVLVSLLGFSAFGVTPTLDAPSPPASVVAGQPFTLSYTLRWEGDAAGVRVLPAETDDVEGGTVRVLRMEAYEEDGQQVVAQEIEVAAEDPGTFEIPEVRIPYATGDVATDENAVATFLAAPAATIEVTEAATYPAWLAPAVGLAAVALAVLLIVWLRRRGQGNEETRQSPAERVQSMMHEAQRHRLDGDYYAFYQKLVAIVKEVSVDEEARTLRGKLEDRVRQVGYQGARPQDDELTGDYRDVERAVARWKEDLGS